MNDSRTYRAFREWEPITDIDQLKDASQEYLLIPIKEKHGRTPEQIAAEKKARKSRRQQVKSSRKRNRK